MNTDVITPPPPAVSSERRQRKTRTPPPLLASPKLETPGAGSNISDRTKIIVARINIGWGNSVYLRGEGGNLKWDVGVPMMCTGEDRWIWSCHETEAPTRFKFLRNDEDWAIGDNEVMSGADITVCNPRFPT